METEKDVCNCLEDNLFKSNCMEKMERVTKVIYSDVSVGVGQQSSLWEQWSAAFLGISVYLKTIRFPSSLMLFFLDGRLDYLSEGKGSSSSKSACD